MLICDNLWSIKTICGLYEKNNEKIRQTFGGTENNAYLCPRKRKKITMNNNTKNNTSDNAGVKSQWMDKLGDYLLDVSKYVLTGVVITSLFSNIKEQALIYSLGILISICSLIAGLLLTNKKKGK